MTTNKLIEKIEEFRKLNPPKITYYYNNPSQSWFKVCSMCGLIKKCKHEVQDDI